MNRKKISVRTEEYPAEFQIFLQNADVYDSSCSPEARVIFIDKDGGYFLKTAPKGTLKTEAEMTSFFHEKKLGAEVLAYLSTDQDYFLTARIPGEDCTFAAYLENPKKLCDTTAMLLRELHETDFSGCPVQNRLKTYAETARKNYKNGAYDLSYFTDIYGTITADEAFHLAENGLSVLKNDTLLHGDYCLPNIMLDDFRFSGFIDVGNGGVGDRHIDLYWGAWTLNFNLKTDRYRTRFFDAYGKDLVDEEKLRTVAAFEVFG